MSARKIIFILLIDFLAARNSFCQFVPGPHPLLSPSINASLMYRGQSEIKDTALRYGFEEAELGFKFPLYTGKDWLSSDGSKPLFAVLFNSQESLKQTTGDFFFKNKQLLRANAGITALLAVGLRNLYLASFQTGWVEDISAIDYSRLRYSGNALWRHRSNDDFNYTLGLSYSYVYGKNYFLPIIGLGYHFTKEEVINIVLPFNIFYTHKFNRQLHLSFFLKPNGGVFYLQLPVNDTITIPDVLFRQRSLMLGVSLAYRTYSNVIFIPEIGVTSRTRLGLDDYKTIAEPSVYFKLGLRYRFGKRATAAPILNFDPGSFGIEENDYLEE